MKKVTEIKENVEESLEQAKVKGKKWLPRIGVGVGVVAIGVGIGALVVTGKGSELITALKQVPEVVPDTAVTEVVENVAEVVM